MEFDPILRAMARSKVRYGLIVLEIALTLAGCWMGVGNFVMYRMVNFRI